MSGLACSGNACRDHPSQAAALSPSPSPIARSHTPSEVTLAPRCGVPQPYLERAQRGSRRSSVPGSNFRARARSSPCSYTASCSFTVLQLHTAPVPKRSSVFRFELQRCFERRGLPGFSISRCETSLWVTVAAAATALSPGCCCWTVELNNQPLLPPHRRHFLVGVLRDGEVREERDGDDPLQHCDPLWLSDRFRI